MQININPIIFTIGPLQLHWYGLMYGLAFLGGYIYLQKAKICKQLTETEKESLIIAVILGVILGGRIGYIIFYNLSYYFQNPLKIFAVWEGGMSFHGGVIGVTLAILWFVKHYKKNIFAVGDIVTLYAPIALFLGRIGNFINGELYGRVAKNFCVYFSTDTVNCRYPSQLLEAFLEGIVLLIILQFVHHKNKKTGVVSAAFFIFYSIFRIIAEIFREPDSQIGYIFKFLTEGQILSILMFGVGIAIYYYRSKTEITHPHHEQ